MSINPAEPLRDAQHVVVLHENLVAAVRAVLAVYDRDVHEETLGNWFTDLEYAIEIARSQVAP